MSAPSLHLFNSTSTPKLGVRNRWSSWRLINKYSFGAATEFATDQSAGGRHADNGGGHPDSSSPTIAARLIRSRSGDGDCNSSQRPDTAADTLIKLLFIRASMHRSPDL